MATRGEEAMKRAPCRVCGKRITTGAATLKTGVCIQCRLAYTHEQIAAMSAQLPRVYHDLDDLPDVSQFGGYPWGSSIVSPVG